MQAVILTKPRQLKGGLFLWLKENNVSDFPQNTTMIARLAFLS